MNSEYFFVIDIGTRFVRGLICQKRPADGEPLKLHVVECEVREHMTRAMRSGQIHDIEKVAEIVKQIKSTLENKIAANKSLCPETANAGDQGGAPQAAPVTLTRVAVAVAGRNLVTYKGSAESARTTLQPITAEDIKQIELAAVQNALENVGTEVEYYCVGYSASGYWLDDEELSTLLDHRASNIKAEVLVTLLPRQVLEAMFAVMKRVDLEIDYLTLEPIAAMESTLSENLRSLNLVLVDIGAGTSDIAVISKGKIRAYGMVPAAGDLVTEAVSNDYLVDFHEAERIKRGVGSLQQPEAAGTDTTVKFKDIFDRTQERSHEEFLQTLRPAVAGLAQRIADEIKMLVPELANGASRQYAVILVGGGSLTPFLEEELSAMLQIPRQRIGIRPASLNREIEDMTAKLHGPDAATATGIALLRGTQAGLSLTHVTINDKRVTAVSSEKNPNILSVLLSNGITVRQIYGRPGMARTFTLNGKLCTIKGDTPQAATVELNGEKVPLDTPVKEGDKVVFYPAIDGKDALKTIGEVLVLPCITFNGKEVTFPASITVNAQEAGADTVIEDRADITYSVITDLKKLLDYYVGRMDTPAEKEIRVDVDGEIVTLKSKQYILKVNGNDVDINQDMTINEHDSIEFQPLESQWKVGDVASLPSSGRDLRVKINGEEYVFSGGKGKILRNGSEAALDELINDNDIIRTVPGKDAEAVLVDIFRYVSVAPQDQAGKRMRLLIDGQESQYTSPLHNDAEIKILFE